MTRAQISDRLRLHEDPVLFREAVNFTAAQTRFAPRLIEKDYFCTLVLDCLAAADDLVFKGGTCLAKVHADFYRLSEDLDWVIPMPLDASRSARRSRAAGLKQAVAALPDMSNAFRLIKPLVGANNSTQYIAVVGYASLIHSQEEPIKIEVGLREPLLTPVVAGKAGTILLYPLSGKPMVQAIPVPCISRDEAMAEKRRAALSRREAAIRDFFDIDYAAGRMGIDPLAPAMVDLVKTKLAVPGNEAIDVSAFRLAALANQLNAQLKPVLRPDDFAAFDLNRAFGIVTAVAAALKGTTP